MFTGIVTNKAVVNRWKPTKNGGKLFIKPKKKFAAVKLGESIAVNGCCLTVVSNKNGVLAFDVSDESMRKTVLGDVQVGDVVNLERAMRASDRLGGHFVLGHVDGVGRVKAVHEHEGSVEYVISYPKKFAALLIEKGSVAVDGVSLTVCDLKGARFSVFIIPHTLKETHLGGVGVGDGVNLEFDVLGKYVLRGSHHGHNLS